MRPLVVTSMVTDSRHELYYRRVDFICSLPKKRAARHRSGGAARPDSMVRAYRSVRRLEQETIYHQDGGAPGAGLVRSHLTVQRPNRLYLEIVQNAADYPTPLLSRFVCDGKCFYAYQEKNGWYTKDKAPKDFQGFDYLAMSVEMASITGNDPIKALVGQARSIHLGQPIAVDGDVADVVVFDTGSADRVGELSFMWASRITFCAASRPKPGPCPGQK